MSTTVEAPARPMLWKQPRIWLMGMAVAVLAIGAVGVGPRALVKLGRHLPYNTNGPRVPSTQDLIAVPAGVVKGEIKRGDPQKAQIALTFDDGPHGDITRKLLAVLREHKVKATFFVVGKMAADQQDIIKEMAADGHCVENHSYTHPTERLTGMPLPQAKEEISKTTALLQELTGRAPRFYRAPGENLNDAVRAAIQEQGLIHVSNTLNTADYTRPGEEAIAKRIIDGVKNGSIVLMHDGVEQTIGAMPQVITTLKARGYTFVTLDELLPAAR